jgi:hypothetical protein
MFVLMGIKLWDTERDICAEEEEFFHFLRGLKPTETQMYALWA